MAANINRVVLVGNLTDGQSATFTVVSASDATTYVKVSFK